MISEIQMAKIQSILKRKAEKVDDLIHLLLNRDEMFCLRTNSNTF